MENGQRYNNWEGVHGEVENCMGTTTTVKGYFSGLKMWWDRLCKNKIRQLYQREQAESRSDLCMKEKHLYECMYDVLQRPGPATKRYLL